MNEVTFEIRKHVAVIKRNGNGWSRELNVVSWNGGPCKYDFREWDPSHERMTRGVTFTLEEGTELLKALKKEFKEV